ncbi:MAG: transposase [Cyanobacteria bacterium J06649_11]
MRAYSEDLREKIIARHEEGTSIRKLAKQFKVSRGTVWNLIKLKRETGSIVPRQATGGKLSQLAEKEAELTEMVRQYSDYTLEEYCEYWDEQTGIRVSPSTMCRKLQKLEWTIKKNST